MIMQPSHLKEAIAYQYLCGVVKLLRAKSIAQLPSSRALALEAGVSTSSMQRAMKRMHSQGTIIIKNKRWGARIAGVHAAAIKTNPHAIQIPEQKKHAEYRWEKIRRLITEDVLNGTYKENQKLPSFKELHLRFGDCYRTIVKALRACSDGGLIRESGNNYTVTPLSRPSRTTIYLFIPEIIFPANISVHDEGHRDFLRLAEVECKNRSLNLKIVDINNLDRRTLAPEYKAGAFGAIVYCSESFKENDSVMDFLLPFNRAVALIDEPEYFRAFNARHHRTHRNVRFFSAGASATAAKNIGTMLIRLGHRKVAFISMHGAEQFLFSRRRLNGLQAAYDSAGF
ncbi:MAG: hypothetical protein PHC61_15935, partial [Chitinivibrionales bacterium]|nr:hypothetical protein [Chitinivibrionales bacterium]